MLPRSYLLHRWIQFEEESQDLLRLHSKDIMGRQSIECLTTIQSKSQEQYGTFVDEGLWANIKPMTATITRNKVEQAHKSKKAGTQVNFLKSESFLFARLYVACQTRGSDLDISSAMKIIHFHHPFLPIIIWIITSREKVKSHGLSWTTCQVPTWFKARDRCEHHGWCCSREHS